MVKFHPSKYSRYLLQPYTKPRHSRSNCSVSVNERDEYDITFADFCNNIAVIPKWLA